MLSTLARGVSLTASALKGRVSVAAFSTIEPSKLEIVRTKTPAAKTDKEKLAFGAVKTDHMLEIDWDHKDGWSAPRITPYHPLQIDPAASCLHYGLEAFEGMKAYLDPSGKARLFRPDLNMRRLDHSMDRLAFPRLNGPAFTECIKALVRTDKDWIPQGEGYSLYLRPTVIGTWPFLGVHAAHKIKLYCIACPVGPYYPEGFKPVRLFADDKHVRAWPGGLGDAKVGGNYAPTIRVQSEAAAKGYSQVLWLFGGDKEVTEVGTMNFFAFWKNKATGRRELVTPPLDGTILPGVTRQSILDLARGWGEFDVSERKFTINELTAAASEGRLLECFGAGTAAVVSPVKAIHFAGTDYAVPLDPTNAAAGAGPLAQRVWDELAAIQYGRADKGGVHHPWSVPVE